MNHIETMLNGIRQTYFPKYTAKPMNGYVADLENFSEKEDIEKLIKMYIGLDQKTRKILTNPSILEKFLAIIVNPRQKPQLQV
jgi:hypothetical protein